MGDFRISVGAWSGAVGMTAQPGEQALPGSIRRRVTPLGRRALAAAWSLAPEQSTRFIFSSRHGEYSRTFSMLQTLAREDTVSPADFSMSVHHALAGAMSIAMRNRQGHTALAAGPDTFGYGLMEAAACLSERPSAPVLLVHYDEPLPDAYGGFADGDAGTVLALSLQSPRGAGDIEVKATPGVVEAPGQSEDLAAAFLAFLCSSEPEAACRGDRMMWRWRRV